MSIDEHFLQRMKDCPTATTPRMVPDASRLTELMTAQMQSRHTDFAARWLQARGEGFYTIGSSGHESNAAVALALRPTDPALLHYRSVAFYLARARQANHADGVGDVLDGVASSVHDQISGGRHKVIGNKRLAIIPQTSTIGSHLPRAVGLAFAVGSARSGHQMEWPADSVVVTSFGDASANHSTTVGALNAASYLRHRGTPLPLLLVCEDNGIGISTKTPAGWSEQQLSALPGIDRFSVDGASPLEVLKALDDAVTLVRTERRPAIVHLRTVRFMGHAGSDAELAYRSRTEIEADWERDPLLATARAVVASGLMSPAQVVDIYENVRAEVMRSATLRQGVQRLATSAEVTRPLTHSRPVEVRRAATLSAVDRDEAFRGKLPESGPSLTLAQTINATLKDALVAQPDTVLFGEDVSRKGGVYGVTRGLRKMFGAGRVFDTILDEQTVLGTALGMSLAGYVPVPEIQYLAYLHNAEDQLRGEAASLQFFSNGQYSNGMVVRIAGLAYQKGFGGHFHNDNSLAVLRDIPGLVVAVASHPAQAPGLLRECLAMARVDGRVCVFVEPIALYHERDLHSAGDDGWVAPYQAPAEWAQGAATFGSVQCFGEGKDLLVVTFGNGIPMSLRAARELEQRSISVTVLDLQWVAPLPEQALVDVAADFDRVLVVDETRASGGVSESVITTLALVANPPLIRRVVSDDSFIPLGPAADAVLLSDAQVVEAALRMFDAPTHRRSS